MSSTPYERYRPAHLAGNQALDRPGRRDGWPVLIGAAQERARQALADREAIALTERDRDAFCQSLDEADKPRPKLAAAAERYNEWRANQGHE